eukprot:scaffold438_cov250-Pinguiococcus_pyrenoidosus.AAC.47
MSFRRAGGWAHPPACSRSTSKYASAACGSAASELKIFATTEKLARMHVHGPAAAAQSRKQGRRCGVGEYKVLAGTASSVHVQRSCSFAAQQRVARIGKPGVPQAPAFAHKQLLEVAKWRWPKERCRDPHTQQASMV